MTPSRSIYNPPNLCSRYAKLSSKFLLINSCSMKLANLYNVCLSQLRHSMLFTIMKNLTMNLDCGSTLIHTIMSIVCVCTQPEMLWIHARWMITLVQNIKIIWYRSICKRIRKAMRWYMPTSIVSAHTETSVTTLICPRPPVPALIRSSYGDLFPESLYNVPSLIEAMTTTFARAKLRAARACAMRFYTKLFPTLLASYCHFHLPPKKETLSGCAGSCLEKPHKALEGQDRNTALWQPFSRLFEYSTLVHQSQARPN